MNPYYAERHVFLIITNETKKSKLQLITFTSVFLINLSLWQA